MRNPLEYKLENKITQIELNVWGLVSFHIMLFWLFLLSIKLFSILCKIVAVLYCFCNGEVSHLFKYRLFDNNSNFYSVFSLTKRWEIQCDIILSALNWGEHWEEENIRWDLEIHLLFVHWDTEKMWNFIAQEVKEIADLVLVSRQPLLMWATIVILQRLKNT